MTRLAYESNNVSIFEEKHLNKGKNSSENLYRGEIH